MLEYFGTSLYEHGHYRWILEEPGMVCKYLRFEDLPFDPEGLTNNLNKGEIIYYQGGGYTVIGISGSCKDNRPGTKSIFWVNEIFSKEKMIEVIKNNQMAANIIKAMSFMSCSIKAVIGNMWSKCQSPSLTLSQSAWLLTCSCNCLGVYPNRSVVLPTFLLPDALRVELSAL